MNTVNVTWIILNNGYWRTGITQCVSICYHLESWQRNVCNMFMLGNAIECYCPNASLSYKFGAYTHRFQGLTVIQVMWENMRSAAALVPYTMHGLILNFNHFYCNPLFGARAAWARLKERNVSSPKRCTAYSTPQLRVVTSTSQVQIQTFTQHMVS